MISDVITTLAKKATQKWCKQRKTEERSKSAKSRRDAMVRTSRVTIRAAAFAVMPEAYNKASGGGQYPAAARQIYYAARAAILEATGADEVNSNYFTQTLLPDYMHEYARDTRGWDVTYDPRGRLTEPHTNRAVPLGTVKVRQYLGEIRPDAPDDLTVEIDHRWPTSGPANRFSALLFIEKEGFEPLLQKAKFAERYDLAIMSTKGIPVIACRRIADRICGSYAIPLLVLHDFDKAGFTILETFVDSERWDEPPPPLSGFHFLEANFHEEQSTRERRRYVYENEFQVIDLGVRLEDVQEYGLESEHVKYRHDPRERLQNNGATREEIEFLCAGGTKRGGFHGRRVELNAFTSEQFVNWLEKKLQHHGVRKVIPDKKTLHDAYRRSLQVKIINEQMPDIIDQAKRDAATKRIPGNLVGEVEKRLDENPELPWDDAVRDIVAKRRS